MDKINFIDILIVLFLNLLIAILANFGDLFESLIKRFVGVKDSSSFLPGHGGFLDRLDSLLFTGPFVYIYLIFIEKIIFLSKTQKIEIWKIVENICGY